MPRPWLRDGDRDADGDVSCEADGGDPPSDGAAACTPFPRLDPPWPDDDAEDAEIVPFPTLDPPWPDGDAADADDADGVRFPTLDPPWPDGDADDGWPVGEHAGAGGASGGRGAARAGGQDGEGGEKAAPLAGPGPGLGPGPSASESAPCRVPHRPVRPVHRRRSRHSFEPEDLSDADLDRLLRGSWPGDGPAGRRPSTGAQTWSAWVRFALAASVLLVVVGGVVGVITAAAGGTTDTVTTRGQGRPPSTTAPPRATDPIPTVPLARLAKTGQSCHLSYVLCVPVAGHVDCADGDGNGPDVYALDLDNDDRACE
jgi:hypothetical protein